MINFDDTKGLINSKQVVYAILNNQIIFGNIESSTSNRQNLSADIHSKNPDVLESEQFNCRIRAMNGEVYDTNEVYLTLDEAKKSIEDMIDVAIIELNDIAKKAEINKAINTINVPNIEVK
jgi:hypothetical protein